MYLKNFHGKSSHYMNKSNLSDGKMFKLKEVNKLVRVNKLQNCI